MSTELERAAEGMRGILEELESRFFHGAVSADRRAAKGLSLFATRDAEGFRKTAAKIRVALVAYEKAKHP